MFWTLKVVVINGSVALLWHNEKVLAFSESAKNKYGSKYLKLPKSSRNAKKKFALSNSANTFSLRQSKSTLPMLKVLIEPKILFLMNLAN